MAAAWLSYCALFVLFYAPAFRVYDAGGLPSLEVLRSFAFALAPNWLFEGGSHPHTTLITMLLYVAIMAAVCASWCWAMRSARTVLLRSSWPLLGMTAVISLPLLAAPGLLSDDVYLYNMYGRAISVYGVNPVLSTPSAFPGDPHLVWAHWQEVPSAYGPIWLMLSAVASAAAADSVTAVVLFYRSAGVIIHLAVVAMLLRMLRRTGRDTLLPAAIFYAWNPLVLLEVVANAHNDVLVALFAVLVVGSAMQHRWLRAAGYAACAVLVKPFAVLLLPAVIRGIVQHTEPARRLTRLAAAAAVAIAVMTVVSLPLWSGIELLKNALNNPAARMYTNTMWELVSDIGSWASGVGTFTFQHPYLDVLRALCFFGGLGLVLTRGRQRADVAVVAIRVWLVFCLTASWVWPWYFVPVLALAPLAGPSQLSSAIGLTIGGLLFWTLWPQRSAWPLDIAYTWRALALFGPLLLIWAWAPARRAVLRALGLRSRVGRGGGDPVDVQLQTAPG